METLMYPRALYLKVFMTDYYKVANSPILISSDSNALDK
jgi:hypothetical protein